MLYSRHLTQEERAKLRRMTRRRLGRISQRAHIILLSAQQRPVPEIADIFEVSQATVRYWIHRFNAGGLEGLQQGKPCKRSSR